MKKTNSAKPSFKEDLACNIALIVVLLFTVAHLVIVTLGFFTKINIEIYDEFNFVIAYILIILSLALYILGFFTYKLTNVYMPSWFRIMFYVAFFLFTNTYYICGWYMSLVGLIFFFAYVAFLVSIICLSVYFNVEKDNKNKLKTVPKHLIVNVYFYSVAICSIFQLLVNFVKAVLFPYYELSTLAVYLFEFGTMFVITTIMILLFALSLYSSKRFINACLIKVNKSKD